MLHLIPSPRVPPGQYRFTHEDGHRSRGGGYKEWQNAIISYRRANGLPIPDNMMAIAEDQLCQAMPPGICQYEDGRDQSEWINTTIELGDIMNGTKVLVALQAERIKSLFTGEDPFVSQELAEQRGAICAACPFNVGAVGCVSCHQLTELVTLFKGDRFTRSEPFLHSRSCAVCKCSSETQIWIPAKTLAKGVNPELLEKFPKDYCWKRLEIEALTTGATSD